MPVERHPSQEVRTAYKAGDISPGMALAITMHAERCAVCRVDIQSLFRPARGGRSAARKRLARQSVADDPLAGVPSPALGELRQSPWRWLAMGIKAAELYGASGLGEAVHLLQLAPGRALPPHAMAAIAQAVVLEGGLRDRDETFGPGDYIDGEAQVLQRPVAERPGGCLCLLVTDGSWPGRGLWTLFGRRRAAKRA